MWLSCYDTAGKQSVDSKMGIIPANTQLQTTIYVDPGDEQKKTQPRVVLRLTTNNNTIIKVAIVFAEGIFEGESHVM